MRAGCSPAIEDAINHVTCQRRQHSVAVDRRPGTCDPVTGTTHHFTHRFACLDDFRHVVIVNHRGDRVRDCYAAQPKAQLAHHIPHCYIDVAPVKAARHGLCHTHYECRKRVDVHNLV